MPHRRAKVFLPGLVFLSLCAPSCERPASQAAPDVAGADRVECATAADCIQVGTCYVTRPSCAPSATYAQIHCGPEAEAALEHIKVPAFTCRCAAGRCEVDHVDRPKPGETPYPE